MWWKSSVKKRKDGVSMPGGIVALKPKWNQQYKTVEEAPAYLNVEEASILWRIPEDLVRKLCSEGKMCAAKFGREWRIDRDKTNQKLFGGN